MHTLSASIHKKLAENIREARKDLKNEFDYNETLKDDKGRRKALSFTKNQGNNIPFDCVAIKKPGPPKFYGILGIDPITDDSKLGTYKKVSVGVSGTGKVTLKK